VGPEDLKIGELLARVQAGGVIYDYILDEDSAAAENSPLVIAPDTNPGDKRWLLLQAAPEALPAIPEEMTDLWATPHRTFYSDGDGGVQELPHGTAGQVLKSQGAAAAPAWDDESAGGGGAVNLITNSQFIACSRADTSPANVGSQLTITDVTSGVCSTANTQGLAVGRLFKFNSGDFSGQTFLVTAVTTNVSFTISDTSKTDTGAPGTGYEVTAAFTGADSYAPDGWTKGGSADLYREASEVRPGALYGLKWVNGATPDSVQWPDAQSALVHSKPSHYKRFAGRTTTFGFWAKTSTASKARIGITDSAGTEYSSYHTGGGAWEWLEVSRACAADISSMFVRVDGGTDNTTYFCQPMLILGSSIGEGNYQPLPNEIIRLDANVADVMYATWSSSGGWTDAAPIPAGTLGKIGLGIKGVQRSGSLNDSGSAAAGSVFVGLRGDGPPAAAAYIACGGLANDALHYAGTFAHAVSALGRFEYNITASGAGTLDTNFWINAVECM
jgi:hypothetical protein